jgi:glycosyltransferase involved in cell wall biosynthesis
VLDLTVIVPFDNEEATLRALLDSLRRIGPSWQLIFIDDGSDDRSAQLLTGLGNALLLTHPRRMGKGAAIRTALSQAVGRVVIIQDADLEYDPAEIARVVEPVLQGGAVACFGSRLWNGFPPGMAWPNRLINRLLVLLVRALYGARLSDEATCYKAVRRDVLLALELRCQRFEFCPEVTAKLLRAGFPIAEVPLGNYRPRRYVEGKKVRWTDGLEAILTLWRYRRWTAPPALAALRQAELEIS